jgi:hypothetical protein
MSGSIRVDAIPVRDSIEKNWNKVEFGMKLAGP